MNIESGNKPAKQNKMKPIVKKTIIGLVVANFVAIIVVMIIGVLLYNGKIGYMPPVEGLLNPQRGNRPLFPEQEQPCLYRLQ